MSNEHETAQSEAEALEAREARINAYLDGEMDEARRASFEADLETDAELREELEMFQSTLGALGGLQAQPAPESFVLEVEGEIRTRSRGRFFENDIFYRTRVPYEAFAALMLAVMAAMYFFGQHKDPKINEDMAAMGGEPTGEDAGAAPEAPEDTPQEAPDEGERPDAEAPGGMAPTPREVVPLRRERIIYTIGLKAVDPKARVDALAGQIRATSSRYQVSATGPDKLQVTMPPDQVESFMASFGKGGRVAKMRVQQMSSKQEDKATVFIHVERLAPGHRPLKPPEQPRAP